MGRQYKIKGINDDVDTCTACGKTNLKRVAWLVALDSEGGEDGDAFPVGMDCAGKMLSWGNSRTKKNISILTDFEKVVAFAKHNSGDRKRVLSVISRLYWRYLGNNAFPTTDKPLVLVQQIEGAEVAVQIW